MKLIKHNLPFLTPTKHDKSFLPLMQASLMLIVTGHTCVPEYTDGMGHRQGITIYIIFNSNAHRNRCLGIRPWIGNNRI